MLELAVSVEEGAALEDSNSNAERIETATEITAKVCNLAKYETAMVDERQHSSGNCC
jgi:hypothetical protein